MKTIILFTIFLPALFNIINGQTCSANGAVSNDCSSGCHIEFISIDNIITQGNAGCSYNGYNFDSKNPRNLVIGSTVTWSINTQSSNSPGAGVAIWIDLNNDKIYQNSEMVASSSPKYQHSGSFKIPVTAAAYTHGFMRVRSGWKHQFTGSDHCATADKFSGETEDYWVNLVCGPNSGPLIGISPSVYTICTGKPATLTAVGALQYTWMPGNLTTSAVVVSPSVTTVYTLTGQAGNCPAALSKKMMSVTVSFPTVVAIPQRSIMCVDEVNIITGGGAETYTWSDPSAGASMRFTASDTGNYLISVDGQDKWGCYGTGSTFVKVEKCAGMDEKKLNSPGEVVVFPNPSSSSFTIRFLIDTHVSIYDRTGKLCREFSLEGTNNEILVSALPPGIYLLKAQHWKGSKKILITD